MNTYPYTDYACKTTYAELIDMYKRLLEEYNNLTSRIEVLEQSIPNVEDIVRVEIEKAIEDVKSSLNEEIADINLKVEQLESLTKQTLTKFESDIDEEFVNIYSALNLQYLNLSNRIDVLNVKMLDNINRLDKRIDDINLRGITVFNQVKGFVTSVQMYIDDVYNALRFNSLTALEFDSKDKTANQLDTFGYTALSFDLNNKNIII